MERERLGPRQESSRDRRSSVVSAMAAENGEVDMCQSLPVWLMADADRLWASASRQLGRAVCANTWRCICWGQAMICVCIDPLQLVRCESL
jgi:hypothetical protein